MNSDIIVALIGAATPIICGVGWLIKMGIQDKKECKARQADLTKELSALTRQVTSQEATIARWEGIASAERSRLGEAVDELKHQQERLNARQDELNLGLGELKILRVDDHSRILKMEMLSLMNDPDVPPQTVIEKYGEYRAHGHNSYIEERFGKFLTSRGVSWPEETKK